VRRSPVAAVAWAALLEQRRAELRRVARRRVEQGPHHK